MSNLNSYSMKVSRDLGVFSLLDQEYQVTVVEGKKSLIAGMDGGSTGTRCLLLDSSDNSRPESLDEVWSIPSISTQTDSSVEILKQSDSLYELMDSWITNTIKPPNDMFVKKRVLRGTKSDDSNLGTERINSSEQKLETPSFYINMIDSIAYGLIQKYNGSLVSEYDIYVGCSLRPDDIVKAKNRQRFIDRFTGSFLWDNEDFGVHIKINIKGITCQTEPEAAVKGYYTRSDAEVPEYVALIEGGGSSIGIEILKDGKHVLSAAQTLPYGGSQLKSSIESLYLEEHGGANLTERDLNMSLEKGYFKVGRSIVDMVPYVKKAKDQLARQIFADIKKLVFDKQSSVTIKQLETVIFSGGLFHSGSFEPTDSDPTASYSLATPLTELFAAQNPSAEYAVLDKNYIPFGNAVSSLTEYWGYLEEVEEDVVSDETNNESAEDQQELL